MKNFKKLVCGAAVVTALALPMTADAWWGPFNNNNNGWGNNNNGWNNSNNNGWGNNNNGYGMGDFFGDGGLDFNMSGRGNGRGTGDSRYNGYNNYNGYNSNNYNGYNNGGYNRGYGPGPGYGYPQAYGPGPGYAYPPQGYAPQQQGHWVPGPAPAPAK